MEKKMTEKDNVIAAGVSDMQESAEELEKIAADVRKALSDLLDAAKMERGQILVVGCSSSEIVAHHIGSFSSREIGETVFDAIHQELRARGIYLAAQCCEHLNRCLIVEESCAKEYRLEQVNVVPMLKAGGSFATAAYAGFDQPTAVERIQAHAGMDIGDTLIGMHLRAVAVPVRTSIRKIGEAR